MTITLHSRSVYLALAACLLATPALAQSEGPLSDLVKRGQRIDVIDDQGRESRGKVRTLSAATVTLERDGKLTEIPIERITQIARPTDNLANGALIGLGAGAAFGILGATAGTSCEPGYIGCPEGAGWVVGSALVMGAIGTGIGVAVDALIRHNRVIYRRDSHRQTRVVPVVGPGVGGAMVSVSWYWLVRRGVPLVSGHGLQSRGAPGLTAPRAHPGRAGPGRV